MPSKIPVRITLGDKVYVGHLRDLSVSGASIEIDAAYESLFRLETKADFVLTASPEFAEQPFHFVVRNARADGPTAFVGVQFQHQGLEEMRAKVRLVTGSSERWMEFQTNREKRIGVTRSALFLVSCGLRYSIEHFAHLMLESNVRRASPAVSGRSA